MWAQVCLCVRTYKELDHVITETEKFWDLQSTSCRPRRANGMVPVQAQSPEKQESWRQRFWSMSESKGQEKTHVLDWRQAKRVDSPIFTLRFYWGRQWIRWHPPPMGSQSALLSLLARNTLTNTSRIMSNQIPGYSVARLGWHIKSTLTDPH